MYRERFWRSKMALNKVAAAQVGKFGKLTASGHSKADNSIFGKNACHTVCSYENSFNDLSVGDNGAFDIFSFQGKKNLDEAIKIMKNEDKPQKAPAKKFEMNAHSFAVLQQELGMSGERESVSICS